MCGSKSVLKDPLNDTVIMSVQQFSTSTQMPRNARVLHQQVESGTVLQSNHQEDMDLYSYVMTTR